MTEREKEIAREGGEFKLFAETMNNEEDLKKLRNIVERSKEVCSQSTESLIKMLIEYNESGALPSGEEKSFIEKVLNNNERDKNSNMGISSSSSSSSIGSNFEIPASTAGVSKSQLFFQSVGLLCRLGKSPDDFKFRTSIKKTITNEVKFKDVLPLFVFCISLNASMVYHLNMFGKIFKFDAFKETIIESGGLNLRDIFELIYRAFEMMSKNYHNELSEISLERGKLAN